MQHVDVFEPADLNELTEVIKTFGIRTSPSESANAFVLKSNCEVFLPIWLEFVNLSLATGSMECLTSAIVLPLIKSLDASTDPEIFKNYRPVSNLEFVSKLIERCVATRLDKHLQLNNLHSSHQYGYKKGHSTELLLLKILNQFLMAFDNNLATVLILLDLSAAFDTVDQDRLLQILRHDIGISGIAYQWFVSFLKGRNQKVKVGDAYSEETRLFYGVPQGSVLGPILYNIYMRRLYPNVTCFFFDIDGFADDHQLFRHFQITFQCQVLLYTINDCMNIVSKWMDQFCLCLNAGKTKIMILGPESVLQNINIHGTFLGNTCLRFVNSAKNLGVWLDSNLKFDKHISKVVASSFQTLRSIGKIKYYVPKDMLNSVLVTLIFNNVDYCNALYYGIELKQLQRLQSIQNTAARMTCGRRKFDRRHITPVLRDLHWLPVKDRVLFKYALIVHKCIWQEAPDSLRNLLTLSNDRTFKLHEQRSISKYGQRAFSRAAPKIWNVLPDYIRCEFSVTKFKKQLKTYMFEHSAVIHHRLQMK